MLWDPFLHLGLPTGLHAGAWRQPFPTFSRARGLRPLSDPSWGSSGIGLEADSDEERVRVRAELPGVAPEDLELTVEGQLLTLGGTFPTPFEDDETRPRRTERPRGRFRQTLELPYRVDVGATEARLERGLLELVLPRAEETKAVQIPVRNPDSPSIPTERS